MTPLDVLSTIRQAGGSVVVVDGDLRIKAPAGLLTQEHKATLVEHKATLVRLLAPDQADDEREAIQWIERLSPAEAEVVVERSLREWDEIVGGSWVEWSEDRDGVTWHVWQRDGESVTAWEDCREPWETRP